MKLYDEIIASWNGMLLECEAKSLPIEADVNWPDVGKDNMILRSDMAYELGGSSASIPALGGTAITDDKNLVSQDEILLVGPDLPEIKNRRIYQIPMGYPDNPPIKYDNYINP